MIKLTIENESITSFQHFEIWGFILTMRNVNIKHVTRCLHHVTRFILTMRNVNENYMKELGENISGFILTMRNVNVEGGNFTGNSNTVLY